MSAIRIDLKTLAYRRGWMDGACGKDCEPPEQYRDGDKRAAYAMGHSVGYGLRVKMFAESKERYKKL